jgi:hypothetical protein
MPLAKCEVQSSDTFYTLTGRAPPRAQLWPSRMTAVITPKITYYPLGNADTARIDFRDERIMLVDFADMRNPSDPTDRRIDLPYELRRHMA